MDSKHFKNSTSINKKPRYRGYVHMVAFVSTLICFVLFMILSMIIRWEVGIFIYVAVQLLLFGTSASYHCINWVTEVGRRTTQRIDHAAIHVLISGTQTAVLISMNPVPSKAIVMTWVLAGVGTVHSILYGGINDTIDVVSYIFHGVSILIPCSTFPNVMMPYRVLFVTGGFLYILGGVLFRFEIFDFYPDIFGFHEVFHLFTVAANMCFAIPIIGKWLDFGFPKC